ncbi:hypothetical protein TNCV_894311 [Trichonephila clavipes]|nr:hypothetical protein TNCV_894311 [Trichonephila clavipes]
MLAPSPEKSGFGLQAQILTWWESGFESSRILPIGNMWVVRVYITPLAKCHGSLVVMAGMSRVQAMYPPCRGTMHIKSVEFKRPPIGVGVRRGEFQLRCRP